jgi:Haem-binding domain
VSLLAVCSIAVHPFGKPKQFDGTKLTAVDLNPPPEVAAIFKRSCMDCHSNHTVWPWYSYVAPMSWLVERDVHRGRVHMNLSDWDQYTFKQREKLLADIASAVKNREMPLPQYTLVHRQAKLSDAETDVVYGWARAERRKLKTSFPFLRTDAK